MKKIILPLMITFVLMTLSCSDTENLTSTDPHDITWQFAKEHLMAMKIVKIIKYTKLDEGYEEKTREIRLEASASWELSAGSSLKETNEPPIDDDGDYYEFYDENGREAQMLETGGLRYYTRVYGSTVHSVSNVRFTPVYSASGPRFTYLTQSTAGAVLGSSSTNHSQKDWWGCVQQEFYLMCGSPLRALLCGAAGGAAPELMLVVYASWMLACLW